MLARSFAALVLPLVLACSASTTAPAAPAGCTLFGRYAITIAPGARGSCGTPRALPDGFDILQTSAGTWAILGSVPTDATVASVAGDPNACRIDETWTRAAAGPCTASSDVGTLSLTVTGDTIAGTLDFDGCRYETIGIDGPACSDRFDVSGVRQ